MGLGKEQHSTSHANHNTDVFQDPFAGNTADPWSSNTDSISHALFIELQLKYHRMLSKITVTGKAPSDHLAQKSFRTTEIGCACYMLVDDIHASPHRKPN